MGSLFGARLADSGHQVVLVDVWAAHVQAIDTAGLAVEDEGTGAPRTVRLTARLPADARGPSELVVLFTKAFQSAGALAGARQVIGPETWILSLQNGLGNVEAIEQVVPRAHIVVGTTTVPADLVGPGRVRTRGGGLTKIMAVEGGLTERLQSIAGALTGAGLPCRVSEDVWTSIWEKLAFNAAMNSLAAVTGLTVGEMGAAPEGRALASDVAAEVVEVARRQGIPADLGSVRSVIAMAFREHVGHKPSMLQDVLAGRPTEIEHINGAVVRAAERLGVPVPITATLYRLVRMREKA